MVELFTSEGCSSCPPADAVLGELVRAHPGRPVFALAFHVDYWDELGWPDRFASPDFTARQGAYARALRARGLYTPQMVVGGTEQFTGSDREHAEEAIARASGRPASVHLTLRARRSGMQAVAVEWTADAAAPGETLSVAVVETSATTSVRAGENAGRTLHHTNVVRSFATVPLSSGPGSRTLPLPLGLGGSLSSPSPSAPRRGWACPSTAPRASRCRRDTVAPSATNLALAPEAGYVGAKEWEGGT